MADHNQPPATAPDSQIEIVNTVTFRGGMPHIHMSMRRVTFIRNGILLPQPEITEVSEQEAIHWLLELVKTSAVMALNVRDSVKGSGMLLPSLRS